VVPLFLKQRLAGRVTVTDERMTRFWLSLEQGVHFVIHCIEQMEGGEVFVPKIPSTKVIDLARAIAPDAVIDIIGIRPGEKLHEVLISEDEARHTVELQRMRRPASGGYLVWLLLERQYQALPDNYHYTSDSNTEWLDVEGIREFVEPFEALYAEGKLEG
jgi:UDP-N-acetylglucosamine 4,6-dehydratase